MKFVDVDKIVWRQSPFLTVSSLSGPPGELKFDLFVTSTDLDEMPSADVVERKKGKWTDVAESSGNGWWDLFIQCSACGYKRDSDGEIFDFCPHCGADMREEKTRWMIQSADRRHLTH